MKKSSLFLLINVVLMACLSGCKEKSAEPQYYLTAKIGNEMVSFEDKLMTAANFGTGKNAFVIAIYPEDLSYGFMITTSTPITGAPSTHRIDFASVQTRAGESLYGSTGTCSISKLDGKSVEGTFSFDAYQAQGTLVQVKEGKFRLKFK
jgi:hypothetical protein